MIDELGVREVKLIIEGREDGTFEATVIFAAGTDGSEFNA